MRRALLSISFALGVLSGCPDNEPVDVCQVSYDCIVEAGCVADEQLRQDTQACSAEFGADSPECAELQEARLADAMATLECEEACAEPEWLDDGNTEVQTDAETGYHRARETAHACNLLASYREQFSEADQEALAEVCAAACDYDCSGTYC
jgi:hypothetical protein